MATTGSGRHAFGARIRTADIAETVFGFCRQNAVGVLHTTFRPLSCKWFYLCPSCSQKRTLLFTEHLMNEVLLDLPHRQFVFTMPKALRPLSRHDRRLFAEVSRLIYTIISEFLMRLKLGLDIISPIRDFRWPRRCPETLGSRAHRYARRSS